MTTRPEPPLEYDLRTSIEGIRDKVLVVHLTHDSAEFLARGCWVELHKNPAGFRVRVYKSGKITEREAPSPSAAIELARATVRSITTSRPT